MNSLFSFYIGLFLHHLLRLSGSSQLTQLFSDHWRDSIMIRLSDNLKLLQEQIKSQHRFLTFERKQIVVGWVDEQRGPLWMCHYLWQIHGEPSSRHIIKAYNSRLIVLSRELLSCPTFVYIEAALWNSVVCLEQLIDSGGFLQLNLQSHTDSWRQSMDVKFCKQPCNRRVNTKIW